MELNSEHFRAIIFYNFRRGFTRQQCIDELNSIFGSIKDQFIDDMVKLRSRSSLKDKFRKGRPKSVVISEIIDAVRQLILQDHHVTYREIKTTLCISGTSIHSILHEHLTDKNICSRRIAHNLSIAQKQARVDWSKEMLQKYDLISPKNGIKS